MHGLQGKCPSLDMKPLSFNVDIQKDGDAYLSKMDSWDCSFQGKYLWGSYNPFSV